MQYSTGKIEREISATGFEFDRGSVYDRLGQLTDVRKAKGKRYRLETVLMIIVLAKLCGCDRPREVADWARNHQEQLVKLLHLERPNLPHYNTYRRIMAHVVFQEEVERLVGEYNQRGEHGEVYVDAKLAYAGGSSTQRIRAKALGSLRMYPGYLDQASPGGKLGADGRHQLGSKHYAFWSQLFSYQPRFTPGLVQQDTGVEGVADVGLEGPPSLTGEGTAMAGLFENETLLSSTKARVRSDWIKSWPRPSRSSRTRMCPPPNDTSRLFSTGWNTPKSGT